MRHPAMLAGVLVLLATPLSAQNGPTSSTRSILLVATKPTSVAVTLLTGTGTAATSWSVDPEQPLLLSLVAVYWTEVPAAVRRPSSGGPKALTFAAQHLMEAGPATLVLFTQPITSANALGSRRDDLPVSSVHRILDLTAVTQ
jgi:hypothetical protein